jgi:hypothetical protein
MKFTACAVAIVASVSLASCSDGVGESCTQAGGTSGVSFTLAPDLYREGREADVKVCQDGHCDSDVMALHESKGKVFASASFSRFSSVFDSGSAQVEVTLRDDTRVVRVTRSEVELSYKYPNGRDCDGDQFLSGQAVLT